MLFGWPVGLRVLLSSREALYESGRFPLPVCRGSAGGKFTLQHLAARWQLQAGEPCPGGLPEGGQGTRFGVLKSQNFEPEGVRFPVIGASLEKHVSDVIAGADGRIVPFVGGLPVRTSGAGPNELRASWPITLCDSGGQGDLRPLGGERGMWESGRAGQFHCDISPGRTPRPGAAHRFRPEYGAGPGHGRQAGCAGGRHPQRLHPAPPYNDREPERSARPRRDAAGGFSTSARSWAQPQPDPDGGVLLPGSRGAGFRDDYAGQLRGPLRRVRCLLPSRQSAKLAGLSRVIVKQIAGYQAQAF